MYLDSARVQVDAESQEDIAESFNIESVPTYLILQVRSTVIAARAASVVLNLTRRAILYLEE